MKNKKPSRKLTALARRIKDSDEFVAHIGNVAEQYRRNFAASTRQAQRETLQSLARFRKYAGELTQWLHHAHARRHSSESVALECISTALHGSPRVAFVESQTVLDWLQRSERSIRSIEKKMLKPHATVTPDALAVAADALRATFAHHGLKLSTAVGGKRTGNAIALLLAIGEDAGGCPLTDKRIRDAFKGNLSR